MARILTESPICCHKKNADSTPSFTPVFLSFILFWSMNMRFQYVFKFCCWRFCHLCGQNMILILKKRFVCEFWPSTSRCWFWKLSLNGDFIKFTLLVILENEFVSVNSCFASSWSLFYYLFSADHFCPKHLFQDMAVLFWIFGICKISLVSRSHLLPFYFDSINISFVSFSDPCYYMLDLVDKCNILIQINIFSCICINL